MLRLKAHAKINWFLRVLGKRADGFHDIQSLMQLIDLADTLTFESAIDIEVITSAPIPASENLVYRAALALRDRAGGRGLGARITLEKEIPIAAGLGGGSSDAACALRGLNELWGLSLGDKELHEIALTLGSDVPFFLGPPCALAEGRGEKLTARSDLKANAIVLLKPQEGVSARWAYGSLSGEFSSPVDIDAFTSALLKLDSSALEALAINDLETPVLSARADVLALKESLRQEGAIMSLMSGSGPTVFGLFRSSNEALSAASRCQAHWVHVTSTII